MLVHVSTYFVNISRASSSYCCLSSADTESKVSSFIKAFEHVPNALLALEANAERNKRKCHGWPVIKTDYML